MIAEDVEWIVNNYGELGVRIQGRNFYLYKGNSLQYNRSSTLNDDRVTPIKYRKVQKREFGECCISPYHDNNDREFTEGSDWKDQ